MTEETKTAKKPAGFGGKKGEQIMSLLAEQPGRPRKEIAEIVGCTVQRVGEAIRAAKLSDAVDTSGTAARFTPAQPNQGEIDAEQLAKQGRQPGGPNEGLPVLGVPFRGTVLNSFRTARCEHEKKSRTKTGSCKVCPPVVAS